MNREEMISDMDSFGVGHHRSQTKWRAFMH